MQNNKFCQIEKSVLNQQGVLQLNEVGQTQQIVSSHLDLLTHLKEGIALMEQMNFTFPDVATLEKFTQWKEFSSKIVP